MKHKIIAISIAALLSGCVVAPTPYYATPVYSTAYTAPVYYNPETVVYPDAESAYVFDVTVGAFFFWAGGYRHCMPHGWSYRTHGVPRGYFHGERHR